MKDPSEIDINKATVFYKLERESEASLRLQSAHGPMPTMPLLNVILFIEKLEQSFSYQGYNIIIILY